jgi:S-adenosylmethionine hydrolase
VKKIISLTSDFGVQTQGVGIMEGTALAIAEDAHVIHLMHGLPAFDLLAAARTMETVRYLPVGSHVCVCDPGVGTERRGIVCQVGRGDFLIGPDNGVLLPACNFLGGLMKVRELLNPEYMLNPVSPLFHGRDVFAPAAAHLSNGVPIEEFGPAIDPLELKLAPYVEATVENGVIFARVIQINRYGSIHLNITHAVWDSFGVRNGNSVTLRFANDELMQVAVCRTFGDVRPGACLILRDDYGRVEVAMNLGSFVRDHTIRIGDTVDIRHT